MKTLFQISAKSWTAPEIEFQKAQIQKVMAKMDLSHGPSMLIGVKYD